MSDCKRVIINTLVIAVAKLILNIIVPLAFALLLNEIRQVKFKKAVQTIVYLPHFLSWVILASVLLEMFGYKGVINSILGVFGIQGKIWFSEENCFRQLDHRFGCLERVRIQCRYLFGSPYRYQPGALRSGSD